jgi:hypothetical protein
VKPDPHEHEGKQNVPASFISDSKERPGSNLLPANPARASAHMSKPWLVLSSLTAPASSPADKILSTVSGSMIKHMDITRMRGFAKGTMTLESCWRRFVATLLKRGTKTLDISSPSKDIDDTCNRAWLQRQARQHADGYVESIAVVAKIDRQSRIECGETAASTCVKFSIGCRPCIFMHTSDFINMLFLGKRPKKHWSEC